MMIYILFALIITSRIHKFYVNMICAVFNVLFAIKNQCYTEFDWLSQMKITLFTNIFSVIGFPIFVAVLDKVVVVCLYSVPF